MLFSTLCLGSDHAGVHLKFSLQQYGLSKSLICQTTGAPDETPFDYPLCVKEVAEFVKKPGAMGLLICGSGLGMSMAANRWSHVRAALCHDTESTFLARAHNNANILILAARFITLDTAHACVDVFLETEFLGGRHQRRLDLFCTQ